MVVGGGVPGMRADAARWMWLAGETLELAAPPQQGLTVSGSSGQTLTGLGPVQEALVSFVARVGKKPRRQRLMAGQVLVFVTTNRFSVGPSFDANSATVKLPYPTDLAPTMTTASNPMHEVITQSRATARPHGLRARLGITRLPSRSSPAARSTSAATIQKPCRQARGPGHTTVSITRHAQRNQQIWATGMSARMPMRTWRTTGTAARRCS
jgi:impB/mucB/samB family C-terminal domain